MMGMLRALRFGIVEAKMDIKGFHSSEMASDNQEWEGSCPSICRWNKNIKKTVEKYSDKGYAFITYTMEGYNGKMVIL